MFHQPAMTCHNDKNLYFWVARKNEDASAVQIVERWILARLRDRRFFSLAELNAAIRELLSQLNTRPFKRRAGNR